MPYITKESRGPLEAQVLENGLNWRAANAGELNYALTRLADSYILRHGVRYQHLNDVSGAMKYAELRIGKYVLENFSGYVGKADAALHGDWSNNGPRQAVHVGLSEMGLDWAAADPETLALAFYCLTLKAALPAITALGVLDCCSKEFYRKLVAPYEEVKEADPLNGPVLRSDPNSGKTY